MVGPLMMVVASAAVEAGLPSREASRGFVTMDKVATHPFIKIQVQGCDSKEVNSRPEQAVPRSTLDSLAQCGAEN